jgi:hypothetical protein
MMNNAPIYSNDDLKAEILRLQGLEREQGIAIKQRFNSPGALFSTLFSLFPKSTEADRESNLFHQDFIGVLSRFLLPFTLNKTIFRNSNFIVKALVGLVSQKASHFISEDSVEGIWDKAKNIFTKLTHKEKKAAAPSYKKIQKEPVVS